MISIKVLGELQKPGIYHVETGIRLSEILGLAKLTRLANGRFTITRAKGAKKESIHIRLDRKASRENRALIFVGDNNFKMQDGDLVWAAFNL